MDLFHKLLLNLIRIVNLGILPGIWDCQYKIDSGKWFLVHQ